MNHRYLPILGALLLAGCASRPASEHLIQVVVEEPLVAASVAGDSVTIRVISTGCTTKDSFVFFTKPAAGGQAVTFARSKLDQCKAAPSPVDLSWTFAELDLPIGANVVVANVLFAPTPR